MYVCAYVRNNSIMNFSLCFDEEILIYLKITKFPVSSYEKCNIFIVFIEIFFLTMELVFISIFLKKYTEQWSD